MVLTDSHLISTDNWNAVFETREANPVLISIPHDGLPFQDFAGLFAQRNRGFFGRDLHVWPIAKDVLMFTRVNAVRGLMHRAFIDYNRAWPDGINYYPLTQKEAHTALDDVRLVSAYRAYHASIDRILKRSIGA